MTFTVHVVPGASAAGALQIALGESSDRIVIGLRDPLSCGPLRSFSQLGQWTTSRRAFWDGAGLSDERTEEDALPDLAPLTSADRVCLWLGTGAGDQITLVWFRHVLRLLEVDADRLQVVQFPEGFSDWCRTPNLGVLRPDQIQLHPAPVALTASELNLLDAAWSALTSASPAPLCRLLPTIDGDSPLRRGLSRVFWRYPHKSTGLNHWEYELLLNAHRRGPSAVNIVAKTLTAPEWDTDPVGDEWLFWRLRRLGDASLSSPLIALAGDTTALRFTTATTTEAGLRVLQGATNAVELNGIDDWVAGVHLSSATGDVWFLEGDDVKEWLD